MTGAPAKGGEMPTISRFYGIVIRMYWREHGASHFHVEYAEHQATFAIETFEVLGGRLPRRVLTLVLEWAMLHRPELRENWERILRREPPLPIAPLDEEA